MTEITLRHDLGKTPKSRGRMATQWLSAFGRVTLIKKQPQRVITAAFQVAFSQDLLDVRPWASLPWLAVRWP